MIYNLKIVQMVHLTRAYGLLIFFIIYASVTQGGLSVIYIIYSMVIILYIVWYYIFAYKFIYVTPGSDDVWSNLNCQGIHRGDKD